MPPPNSAARSRRPTSPSPEQVADAVRTAAASGPLRVVVNCAGIAPPAKVLDREGNPSPLDAFERIIRVNLIGTYNVIAQASAVMSRTEPDADSGDRGVIVNTASVAAFDGQIGQPAYSASKGGVHAMTLPIARELARYGIRVVTIAPGIMETPMLAGLPQAAQDSLGEQVPYPARLGRPDEYASLVLEAVRQRLPQRRDDPPRRCDPHGAEVVADQENHERFDPSHPRGSARARDVQPSGVPQRDGLRDGHALARHRARGHLRPVRRGGDPGCRRPGLLRRGRRRRDGDLRRGRRGGDRDRSRHPRRHPHVGALGQADRRRRAGRGRRGRARTDAERRLHRRLRRRRSS